jgi:IS30 family transposase
MNYMVANWADFLFDFDINIVHRPGLQMVLPDALSRLFYFSRGDEVPEDPAPTTEKNRRINWKLEDEGSSINELQEFIKERMGKRTPPKEERGQLLQQIHLMGHFGTEQMFKQLWWQGYYWPTMRQDCKEVTSTCKPCLQNNIQRQGFHPMSSIHAEFAWDQIAMDLAGPLQVTKQGYNMILVITDVCSRFTLLRPLKGKTAKEVSRALYQVFSDFGVPKRIQSDNGKEFVNEVIQKMKQLLGIEHRLISPYHPEANGVAEASVKIVKQILTKISKGNINQWDKYLPTVQMMMNNRIMSRTKSCPFELCYGRPWNDWKNFQGSRSKLPSEQEQQKYLKELREIVYPIIDQLSKDQASKEVVDFSVQHKVQAPLAPGTQVMVKQVDKVPGDDNYAGPYIVNRVNKGGAYILTGPTGEAFPHKVPRKLLKIIQSSKEPTVQEYIVEKVLNHRGPPNKRQYLVKWKGYPPSSNSWEPEENFNGKQALIQYWRSLN